MPLDRAAEAVIIGLLFPLLWWFHPQFLGTHPVNGDRNSVFYGTSRDHLALWQPGVSVRALVPRMIESVMMVVTVNDPPRWDPYALPVIVGGAVSALAVAGVPGARRLPAGVVIFFFAAIAGALIARGSAYAGRVSIHVIPVASAAFVCAVAAATSRVHRQRPVSSPVHFEVSGSA
jgi:hypothetical protein